MSQAYSDPSRESDPHALPDVEVFKVTERMAREEFGPNDDGELMEAGWYYWYCFPGCLPDSEPVGPFATETEALADARQS